MGGERVGEPASQPQLLRGDAVGSRLVDVDPTQFDVRDPAGQALRGHLDQVEGRRPEEQELPGPEARPTVVVNDAAQGGEQLGDAVDLVQDHQVGGLVPQVGVRIVEAATVGRPLQVEVGGAPRPAVSEFARQRRLADLPWTQEHRGSRRADSTPEFLRLEPLDHHANLTSHIRFASVSGVWQRGVFTSGTGRACSGAARGCECGRRRSPNGASTSHLLQHSNVAVGVTAQVMSPAMSMGPG